MTFTALKYNLWSDLFRQYKDKEEENQGGFFSAFTNYGKSF
uniref:Uncharacterized protein n=1 Tax=Anguilla anguilla TaxID=7936 RepID=A0A0E9PH88_ANGAN